MELLKLNGSNIKDQLTDFIEIENEKFLKSLCCVTLFHLKRKMNDLIVDKALQDLDEDW